MGPVPPEKIVPNFAPDGQAYLFLLAGSRCFVPFRTFWDGLFCSFNSTCGEAEGGGGLAEGAAEGVASPGG
jgi:hypothetical protein